MLRGWPLHAQMSRSHSRRRASKRNPRWLLNRKPAAGGGLCVSVTAFFLPGSGSAKSLFVPLFVSEEG